ncbi:c-type cytochrome [Mycoavidus sp. B2-EB]|uniref:c-type cytochrome n=1 Tax=Mycoavidus sp. B2-EB TaxID=2651972 RepID=UPI0016241879|nr:c-type cytochrome [Mycoavidus sp. B2-EB]BBO60501.1 cytochrome c551 [Mycoavidus sp. B2-EB]
MRVGKLNKILRQVIRTVALWLSVATCAVSSHAVYATDAAQAQLLIRRNACMSCHTTDQKRIGPSYLAVAAKYKDKPEALAQLVEKIKKGGAGAWGAVPMPSHPRLSETDAQTIVAWVLAGAPPK